MPDRRCSLDQRLLLQPICERYSMHYSRRCRWSDGRPSAEPSVAVMNCVINEMPRREILTSDPGGRLWSLPVQIFEWSLRRNRAA